MQHVREIISEMEWEIDSHRIKFSEFLAMGREDLAAHEDFLIRQLTDDLHQVIGQDELEIIMQKRA